MAIHLSTHILKSVPVTGKNMSMRPILVRPNITTIVNVTFQEILE